MSTTTIKMLAKELNLSVSTVSKALRDSHEISLETKQKVTELARKLDYVPNPYASSLRRRSSKTIAVVIPEVADSFFSQAINGIEEVAQEKGYHVLIYLTHESLERESAILNEFRSGRVDGILISVSAETNRSGHIRELMADGIQVIFFDRICEDVDTAKVITDDLESSYKATMHLIENGCRRIAYLYSSRDLSISNNRLQGYKKAMEESGLGTREELIVLCNEDNLGNKKIIKTLLGKKMQPDGLIASVEKLITPCYLACQELDLDMPGHIKIISFTNLTSATILNPALTTVTQPAFEMGTAAAGILFRALEKKNIDLKSENLVIPSKLNVRKSTS